MAPSPLNGDWARAPYRLMSQWPLVGVKSVVVLLSRYKLNLSRDAAEQAGARLMGGPLPWPSSAHPLGYAMWPCTVAMKRLGCAEFADKSDK